MKSSQVPTRSSVPLHWFFSVLVAMMLAMLLPAAQSHAATPLAGAGIGNSAAASYTDASAVPRNVTSNTVTTTVLQIASFTLTATQSKTGAPGSTVYFPHVLTNTGNGNDTFNLSAVDAAGDSFNFTSLQIYADANGDGVPDNAINLASTGALAAGGVFKFVVAAIVPGSALNTNTGILTLSATGTATATPAPTQTNTDTVTVSANAVISVTKAASVGSGPSPFTPLTYTLTYTNTGNNTATAVTLTDVIPTGMTYIANSGRWSVTGSGYPGGTVLTDANNADAQGPTPTITYDFGVTVANRVTAVISAIPPGTSGTVTFQVSVNTGVAPSTINNTAAYTYNDGVVAVPSQNTNAAPYVVNQVAALTQTGSTVASAAQGSTVPFTNVVTNNGNGIDSFDITIGTSTFPVGTTFQLFKSDGVTPLVDTNGNSTPDTGPVAPGATYNVILKATLPAGATGGPFTVQKIATSKFDPTKTATATDTLTVITANTVDITNNTARTDSTPAGTAAAGNAATTGFGTTGTTTIITNPAIVPGATTIFTLVVNNTSGVADSFNLTAPGVPPGWTVVFKDSLGATVTNTGTINSLSNKTFTASVTAPANAAPGTTTFDFTVTSPTSGATDAIRDAVVVQAVNSVTLTPNNTGQVFPGGSVVYTHTLTNNGNVSQPITFPGSFLTDSQVAAGWTSTLYRDTGATPGVLDGTDPAVTNATTFSLAAGASATLFVKVFAPLGAAVGAINTTTVVATYPTGTATATDTSTVIGGQVTLVKKQALDATCDGLADTAFALTIISAKPGECVRYEITATNAGTSNVTGLVVSDATPTSTTYHITVPAATTVGTITAPASGAAGTISATVGTLTPNQFAVVTFGVRIDP